MLIVMTFSLHYQLRRVSERHEPYFRAGSLCGHKTVASRFFIDFGREKACILHVAQRPLTKGVLYAPGDTDVTGDSEKSRAWSIGGSPS
jgi:hypothetical protein